MAFQGNPNAGALDPNLMHLLFQARKDRAALAIQQQKMQLLAQQAAKEDARADEKHRLDTLMQRANLASELQAMAPGVDSARRNATETTSKNLTGDDLMADGGGEDFAQIVMQNDPTVPGQVQESAAAQANFAQSLGQFGELQRELNPGIDPILSALGAGQSISTSRDFEARTELEKTIAQEGRQKIKEDAAREDEQRHAERQTRISDELATTRPVRATKSRERELQTLSNKIADPNITGDERELIENQYRAIRAEADADLTRSQPAEAVTESRRRADDNLQYDQVYDQSRSVNELLKRLESGDTASIGIEGWGSEVLSNFNDLINTTSSIPLVDRYSATLNRVLDNPDNTPAEKQQIIDSYFSQENLDRVANGQLTEREMRWWIMYSLNPDGRVSNMLSQEMKEVTNIIGPTVGPKQALSRLRAVSQRQQQFLRRRRSYIGQVNKSEAFDPKDGRRVASESLPMPTGAPATKKKSTAEPKMSPADRAAAIESGGQPR